MLHKPIYVYIGILFLAIVNAYEYNYCQAPGVVPSIETDGYTLQFVQAISRHGDRSPTQTLLPTPGDNVAWDCSLNQLIITSNDTYLSEPIPGRLYRKLYINDRELLYPGNCALGQLTTLGLQQTVTLGQQLKSLYVDQYNFLPTEYDNDVFYIRSTDVPRTVQSAQGQFLGMYPPTASDESIEIIPINTMDENVDDMTPNYVTCPNLETVWDELTNSSQWAQHEAEYQPLQQKLQTIFETTETLGYQELFDALMARKCHNLPFPNGITVEILDQILNASNWEQSFLYNDPIAGPLGAGQFLQELVDAIDAFILGQSIPIYILYSGHDSTLAPLLGNLGVYDDNWPPYVSNMQIELWLDDDATPPYGAEDYYVEMKYNSEYIQLPSCSNVMCNYGSEWRPYAMTKIPTDAECGITTPKKYWMGRH